MKLRKNLCATNFIKTIFSVFSKIQNSKSSKSKDQITLADCLMSCYAVFSLKWPSLLQFDKRRHNSKIKDNLKNLFLINKAPSDTYLRECLDVLDPDKIRPAFKKIFALLQRDKALESYKFINNSYLISIDGTGHFASSKVSCENCCVKNKDNERRSYYHQMLSAVIVHPSQKQVIPLCPEPIVGHTDASKNDCEQRATRRILDHIRREHPHLNITVVQDALSDCGPNVRQLEKHSMNYIIVRKGNPLAWGNKDDIETYKFTDTSGLEHCYRFRNGDSLNNSHLDVKTNVLEYRYINKKGKEIRWCWITNINISKENVHLLMQGGRSRWKIENETFQTLKNQGYNFEHNYGHGNKNLCTVMSFLMLLAFLVDQSQQLSCMLFQTAKQERRTFYELWETMRVYFRDFLWENWELFLATIAQVKIENSS